MPVETACEQNVKMEILTEYFFARPQPSLDVPDRSLRQVLRSSHGPHALDPGSFWPILVRGRPVHLTKSEDMPHEHDDAP